MKIAIFPGYGMSYIPANLRKKLQEEELVKYRAELARVVEDLEITHEEVTPEVYENFKYGFPENEDELYYLKSSKNEDRVYFKDTESMLGFIYEVEIVEVDTSRIWKISEYDGAEYIDYHREPKILNKELNYGSW